MKPSNYLIIFVIGVVVGYLSHFPIIVDDQPTPRIGITHEPVLEPTPTQEEINERVTKALRLNPPL